MLIYEADHPLVLNGTYDREGYKPGERRRLEKARARQQPKGPTMRLFNADGIGVYLDDIGHRVEKNDGNEVKMVDLTLRVQPFTPDLAVSLDPDVRALLFNMTDAAPKPKIKAMHFNLTVPRQAMTVALLPPGTADNTGRLFSDVEITDPRARTEKGVDGFALVFYASLGPLSAADLEYVCEWLTQQRFLTFHPQEPALNFDAAEDAEDAKEPARRVPRRNPKQPPVVAGDEIRPGVHAEH
jgi:hypothetical protein